MKFLLHCNCLSAIMDFTHLNYCYPGTPNAARLHFNASQQLQESLHHASIQSIQSMQEQTNPGDGHVWSDPSRITHPRPSLGFTADYDLHPKQKSDLVGPRSAIHSHPTGPTKVHCVDGSADLSDQYIPSSSDKITCTDHRPLDDIFGNVWPSSGRSCATSGSQYPSQNGTPRGPPGLTSILTYPLPTRPLQLDGVVHIPLLAVDNQNSGTGLVVDFRCSDWGIGVQVEGIPMSDLLHGNVSGLESPHQRVLYGLGDTNLRLNILWPHYPPFVKVISAFGTDGRSMTRAELGYEVSLAFAEFFYQITLQSTSPTQSGPYAISSSSPGIKFEQLHLITVRNTSRGEWMAEIRAVSMP